MRVSALVSRIMKSIGTHDGKFHADEALACYMLQQLDTYRDAKIVRTRDASLLNKCDIVVDVGGVFDAAKHRYDHHQRDFTHTMRTLNKLPFDTKLSSAGLVYAHFGVDVLRSMLPVDDGDQDSLQLLFHKMYSCFVEEIDGNDNGIEPFDGKPRYKVNTTLACRVSSLYPAWNSKEKPDIDMQFLKAVQLTGAEFKDAALYYLQSWLPARQVVAEAYNNRLKVHSSGRILCLENGGVPWKEHLFSVEGESDQVLYVLFADDKSMWRVQAVPKSENDPFANRLALPEQWRGLRDAELSSVAGIEGCTFCHATGFIAGNATKDGALNMAQKAIAMQAANGDAK